MSSDKLKATGRQDARVIVSVIYDTIIKSKFKSSYILASEVSGDGLSYGCYDRPLADTANDAPVARQRTLAVNIVLLT